MLLSLACRNLLRNKKRSLITMLAIAIGLGAMLFYGASMTACTTA
ncbi:MAG: hypothetical protein Q9M28_03125 [Mariprofundaceae bacterium]|nr:hypothetical protein [Mariprofundaceae bacterium]